ncbi:hypothetical protein PRZ48_001967 [Zasmidium cellare]|uniref:O-methyltransferase domain-containing protein n=1 Tax=Zasmidium cellare TaxID=395010 RepID=A0ABR0F3R6_ZASCE|nr:hypothetical protein PRZ48_001967 [Zasmidium cellare]
MEQAHEIQALAQEIHMVAMRAPAGVSQDPEASKRLRQLSKNLTSCLQTPDQVVMSTAYSGLKLACVRIAINMRLFDTLTRSDGPLGVKDLAKTCNADESFVLRVGRMLVEMRFIDEMDGGFSANAVTKHMTIPSVEAGMKIHFDQGFPILVHTPAYFEFNGYQVPISEDDSPFKWAFNTTDDVYTHWSKQPGVMETFSVFMQGMFQSSQWLAPTDWFPFDEVCFDSFDQARGDGYSFVEIGGGKGDRMQALVEKYPNARGKLLLQDTPAVIEDIAKSSRKLSCRIETMAYDFLDEQPITGAKTYFLENILHNWTDGVCLKILANVRQAMTRGYSKLLVSNIVMPDSGASLAETGLDILMLLCTGGSQRNDEQWHNLLETAGFRIVKIWMPPGAGNGVIEAAVDLGRQSVECPKAVSEVEVCLKE